MTVWLGRREKGGKRVEEEEWLESVDWSEVAREKFRRSTEDVELGKGGVNEEMEKLIERIKGAVRVKRWRRKGEGRRGWWDGEYRRKKRGGEGIERMEERG